VDLWLAQHARADLLASNCIALINLDLLPLVFIVLPACHFPELPLPPQQRVVESEDDATAAQQQQQHQAQIPRSAALRYLFIGALLLACILHSGIGLHYYRPHSWSRIVAYDVYTTDVGSSNQEQFVIRLRLDQHAVEHGRLLDTLQRLQQHAAHHLDIRHTTLDPSTTAHRLRLWSLNEWLPLWLITNRSTVTASRLDDNTTHNTLLSKHLIRSKSEYEQQQEQHRLEMERLMRERELREQELQQKLEQQKQQQQQQQQQQLEQQQQQQLEQQKQQKLEQQQQKQQQQQQLEQQQQKQQQQLEQQQQQQQQLEHLNEAQGNRQEPAEQPTTTYTKSETPRITYASKHEDVRHNQHRSRAHQLLHGKSIEECEQYLQQLTRDRSQTPIRALYLSGADSRTLNLGHELHYETFVRFMTDRLNRFRRIGDASPLPSLLVSEIQVDASSCQLDQSFQADVADGLMVEQVDFLVLGGGSVVRERAMCVLWRLLNQRPELPVFIWGSGFDDLALVTANRNVMHNLRSNRFQNVQFSATSGIAIASAALFTPSLVAFGGVRGNYSTQFIARMAPNSPVKAIGEAGLLFQYDTADSEASKPPAAIERIAADRAQRLNELFGNVTQHPNLSETKSKTTTTTTADGTELDYVMVNFGIPTEGANTMYGKQAQLATVASALIKVMHTLAMKHRVYLYATSTTDLVHLRTLYNATIGNAHEQFHRIDTSRIIMVHSVPDTRLLLSMLQHSVLSIAIRYHAVLLSIRAQVPLVALAYRFKTIELCDSVGSLRQFTVATDDITTHGLHALVGRAMDNADAIRKVLSTSKEQCNAMQCNAMQSNAIQCNPMQSNPS
jgi:chemotaxis protein histidine kinase CheA